MRAQTGPQLPLAARVSPEAGAQGKGETETVLLLPALAFLCVPGQRLERTDAALAAGPETLGFHSPWLQAKAEIVGVGLNAGGRGPARGRGTGNLRGVQRPLPETLVSRHYRRNALGESRCCSRVLGVR